MNFVSIFILLVLLSFVEAQVSILDSYENLKVFRSLRKEIAKFMNPTIEKNKNDPIFSEKLQIKIEESIPFPCNVTGFRSKIKPKNVNRLRPGDIDVIGAIGDSLTVGFGIFSNHVVYTLMENRGASFSMGGDATWRIYTTLPNIIKEFNPNLIGYSTGNSLSVEPGSYFNVAEGGAVSDNMPYMAKILTRRILNDKNVDVKNDWKLITIFIGHNDFCSEICYLQNPRWSLEKHEKDILSVLRTFREHLPRTLVNLLVPVDTILLKKLNKKPSTCFITHSVECPCIFGLSFQNRLKLYQEIIKRWQILDQEIAKRPEFNTDDFTVVAQDVTTNVYMPLDHNSDGDLTMFSSDCFHLSQKGNAALATNLWNSMLEPVGHKNFTFNFNVMENFHCPSEEKPFIFTNENSKLVT